jgi:phage shock protein PspC (stress-responsive transcriptional regulator)
MIAGVCAGLAEYFGFDTTVVRVCYALLTVFTAFSGVIVYLILMIIMPERRW